MLFRSTLLFLIFTAFSCSSVFGAQYPRVLLKTNFGDITIELYNDKAPITVENFLHYVRIGFYDQTLFHRVIEDFMIQGGGLYMYGPYGPFSQPTNGPIINESYNNLSNLRGTVAMARTDEPNSATSQFFINHVDNTFLDKKNALDKFGYCVFGNVISDMNVVDTIARQPTDGNDYPDPNMVIINSAKIITPGYWFSADINNNGIANMADFTFIAANWKKTGSNLWGDLNQNTIVDTKDIFAFTEDWLYKTTWYKPVAADIDNDKIINFDDFAILSYQWGWLGRRLAADLNNDWTVDEFDMIIVMQYWLETIE